MLDDAVTLWLAGLRNGEADAAQKLWQRYFEQLVRLTGNRLPAHARRDFDEEDVALSAFRSLFAGIQEQRFPQLGDRDDLWALLVVITRRKAAAYVRHGTRLKRGGVGTTAHEVDLDALLGEEPTPDFAAEVAEQCNKLMAWLGDDALREIALHKMQGYTVEEIAERSGTTRRTVERRLQIIRKKWAALHTAETDPVT